MKTECMKLPNILNNFNKSTFDGEFDALFAVQSVPMLIRYYKIFKELKPDIVLALCSLMQQIQVRMTNSQE